MLQPVYLDLNRPFPDPHQALSDPNGLLAIGADLSSKRLIDAYNNGIFPWFSDEQPVLWWSPDPRIGLELSSHTISKSMRKFIRKSSLKVTINRDFEQVIRQCALQREGETWINNDMYQAYIKLHQLGHAQSVEVWQQQQLVGGLYGVNVGQVFCGESMFHTVSNASKLAFHLFCQHFAAHGGVYIDGQVENPHLLSLGMQTLARDDFLSLLKTTKDKPLNPSCWRPQEIR
ncbi:leucyl/phenylalanyl-tRNA--protein transferase [Agarivorans sp. 1_MG-2023]|nr:leucyl/phenylalanyl-tRNA--protein transferase [Agarivorans sp. 1_MG-2023]MDO6765372.1 leucyl/phenylalanyl-tRNA--protein transferase [Agarivorans sp. 1_MG-2023]